MCVVFFKRVDDCQMHLVHVTVFSKAIKHRSSFSNSYPLQGRHGRFVVGKTARAEFCQYFVRFRGNEVSRKNAYKIY